MSCGYGKTEIMLNKSSVPMAQSPAVPTNLTLVETGNGEFHFSWDKLAEGGYSYNIKIGTTQGGGEIVSCNALMNGKLTVPKAGHAGISGIYILKRDLPAGTYYWTVQAIDNAYRGSEFAEVQQFSVTETTGTIIKEAVDSDESGLIIRPNPATDYFTFNMENVSNITVEIFNIQGEKVISHNNYNDNIVRVGDLSNGIYVCRVVHNGIISVHKLLIQR